MIASTPSLTSRGLEEGCETVKTVWAVTRVGEVSADGKDSKEWVEDDRRGRFEDKATLTDCDLSNTKLQFIE
jgi:hypothetical protein